MEILNTDFENNSCAVRGLSEAKLNDLQTCQRASKNTNWYKIPTLIIFAIGLFVCLGGCNRSEKSPLLDYNDTAEKTFPVYYDRINDVADYVLACQIPQGGLCRNISERNNRSGKECFMTTYCFGGTALVKAFQMTGKKEYLDGARKFIDFWMMYQNKEPDRFGVVGTFYDKYLDSNTSEIKNHYYSVTESVSNKGGPGYDASDADGPTIAWTVWEYYKLTGDKKLLEQYCDNFKLILKSMEATLDSNDWLTRCHPQWPFKYLMDVCEVWAFLGSLENIFTELQEHELALYCGQWQDNIRQTINKKWWNAKDSWYYWYEDNGGNFNKSLDWNKWYPDAAEQIWPMLWGVTSAEQVETKLVWKQFNQNIPDWPRTGVEWPMAGNCAAMMGDFEKAIQLNKNILNEKLNAEDFQTNQCYFVILNCCIDFELTGSLYMVKDSFVADNNNVKFNFATIPNGGGEIIFRINNPDKTTILINGLRQMFKSVNGKCIIPVKMNAGQIISCELIYEKDVK